MGSASVVAGVSAASSEAVQGASAGSTSPVRVAASASSRPVQAAASAPPRPVQAAASAPSKPAQVAAPASSRPAQVAAPASSEPVEAAAGESAGSVQAGAAVSSGVVKPLHDPDPYSTPPYGEPGPWALAPPVQHPVATPPHGTPVVPTVPRQESPHAQPPAAPQVPSVPAPPAPDTPPAPSDPWQRYDPWASPSGAEQPSAGAGGPLQQNGAAVPSRQQRRRRARRLLIGAALALALMSGGLGGAVGAYLERNGGIADVELPQAGKEPAGRAPDSVAGIAARALPSVVTLHVSGGGEGGTGTGFVLDGSGHILTNNHVVEPAGSDGEITVTFHSGDTAKAEVVGRDGGYDLAVVKVTGVKGLQPAPLGNSENVQVGDPVVAIGAPFDLSGTVTSGIISAKERPITAGGERGDGSDISYVDALQTDAPINPGNSGGPLLDSRGRVIGINSAIRSAGSGSETDGGQAGSIGLGFAIPINQGKRVAEELINTGRATHPVIGVTLDMNHSGDGARVGTEGSDGGSPVTAGGPGDRAGIEPGDVITEIDGRRVHSGEELIIKIRSHRPGDRLELTLRRDGQERTVSLVLGSSDGD
ncbi:trypsin-like peptidase domain-containing protein [Streptomyces sp. NPDC088789]|uniref:S1C family serine protease n=1 Tax=Streptomyces sp. NPDC088789 TaxID=3365899 RepID=UPI0037F44458